MGYKFRVCGVVYQSFHYSQIRIEKEIRIKRTRQDAIIRRFCELGFLTTTINRSTLTAGNVRYFHVNFDVLADQAVLRRIISESTPLFELFRQYTGYHAEIQLSGKKEKENNKAKEEARAAAVIANRVYRDLDQIYEARRIFYNEGKLTGQKPKQFKLPTQLQRNKKIDRRLVELSRRYRSDVIENAFMVYVDDIFKEKANPKSLMNYFLTYSRTMNEFTVFDYYMNQFTLDYISTENI